MPKSPVCQVSTNAKVLMGKVRQFDVTFRYFSASSHLAISSWTTADSDALAPCGHCDNCTCLPEDVDHKDVTIEAWQIVKICDSVHRSGQRFTVSQLADFVRGGSSVDANTSIGGGKKGKEELAEMDLDAISGGKVTMNKDVSPSNQLSRFDDPSLVEINSTSRRSWCNF
jgi:superfamily II DNA helicase RecQ